MSHKILTTALLLIFTLPSNADESKRITCTYDDPGEEKQVRFDLNGVITKNSDDKATLRYSATLIYVQGEEATERNVLFSHEMELKNVPYKGRKYTNHFRFNMKWHSTYASLDQADLIISKDPVSSNIEKGRFGATIETYTGALDVSYNDFHGALAPIRAMSKESKGIPRTLFENGGAASLAGFINILRNEYGSRFLVMDAGDQWQGTMESGFEKGKSVIDFYNEVEVSAATIGNHEFDFGREKLNQNLKEADYPYVSANIFPAEFPNTKPHIIIKAGDLKVGVIGLTTRDTPRTTRPTHVKGLKFTDFKEATLKNAKSLREKGAHIIIILAHAPAECENSLKLNRLWSARSTQGSCHDEIPDLLKSIPYGTVDAVITGHNHKIVHHWISGIPVIQAGASSKFFNLIYLTYNKRSKSLIPTFTRIEGPVPNCHHIFQHQKDCNGFKKAPTGGRGHWIQNYFHGKKVIPDSDVQDILEEIKPKIFEIKEKIIGLAARKINRSRTKESELGNLIADAMIQKTGADFALMNPGGIRTNLQPGPISYGELYKVLPFENQLSLLTVTGVELKKIIRVANSGVRGFYGISGLKLKVIDLKYSAPQNDLNHDGKISPWETNRLVDIRFPNGSRIRNHHMYKLVTIDYLVQGGEHFKWVMSKIPQERIVMNVGIGIRDTVSEYISKSGPINTVAKPLVNPEHPRLTLIIPKNRKMRTNTKNWGNRE